MANHSTIPSASASELSRLYLFQEVAPELPPAALGGHPVRIVAPGETLLSPESENHSLHLLLSGRLSVRLGNPAGPEIRVMEAGSVAGEISMIERSRPSAWVVAAETCRVLELPEAQVWKLVEHDGRIARNLMTHLAGLIRDNAGAMEENHREIRDLEWRIRVDGLTGLFNRHWLDHCMERELARSGQEGAPTCLIMVDVDHFKRYNDTQGHQGGDRALIALAQVLAEHTRPHDLAARYGGEEFSVLLPETGLEEACEVAERLRSEAQRLEIFAADGTPLPGITISLGVAQGGADSTPRSLYEAADAHLYAAKKGGRNRVCT